MLTIGTWWLWLIFFLIVGAIMLIDILLFRGGSAHRVSLKESASWVLVWMTFALLFDAGLWFYLQKTSGSVVAYAKATEFLTGYFIEWSLSVDNLFVFLLIFKFFVVPAELQRRTLLYGVLGAIIMRLLFITIGVWLVVKFHWILYLFGLFLIYSGIKIIKHADDEPDLAQNPILLWMKKHLRMTPTFVKERFFVRKNQLLYCTPLFVVLVLIEFSDVIFALDSIPAIFAVTTDPFIIYTSNIFAILGLRAMYFMLARMHELFELLKHGVALILVFIGMKMLVSPWYKIPTYFALSVVLLTLLLCILLSLRKKKRSH